MIKGLFDGKRWNALFAAFPEYYIPGFLMTLKISLVGLAVALVLGVIFGMFSSSKWKLLKIISRIYVEFIQNTPLALQVMCYYSVLPMLFSSSGFRIPKFVLGVIGVGVYHGAYISEVIRTGIEAIPKGQSEAAASQGFSYLETMYHIILPQTIKIIMPPLANQALNLVKNTSILAMVAGMDLMYFTDSWGADRGYFAQAYFTSAVMYFIICFPLARLARYLEIRSMRLPVAKKLDIQADEEAAC
jgi:putative glutamine transport system permease protein